jgi:hypothetical protein
MIDFEDWDMDMMTTFGLLGFWSFSLLEKGGERVVEYEEGVTELQTG